MENKREITGWAMYDWANSAFATTVVTAFLGPFLAALIASRPEGILPLGPYRIEPEAFYPFCVTASVILQVVFLPLLGSLADFSNLKKRLLILFATIGAVGTIMLGLVSGGNWVLVGGLLFTWWFPQRRLVERKTAVSPPTGSQFFTHSVRQFVDTLRDMIHNHPRTLQFLIAYLIYNDGIMTVNTVAAIFASSELGMGPEQLVGVILMIQFVAALGAIVFGKVAGWIGAKWTVIITLLGWTGLLVYAFGWLVTPAHVWIWAAVEALVLGSSQALSRSIFAKMVPANRESAYFSLYEISERGTSWIGPLVFGLAVQVTGSARSALLPLATFFVVGILILLTTNVRQAIVDAGNEVPALV